MNALGYLRVMFTVDPPGQVSVSVACPFVGDHIPRTSEEVSNDEDPRREQRHHRQAGPRCMEFRGQPQDEPRWRTDILEDCIRHCWGGTKGEVMRGTIVALALAVLPIGCASAEPESSNLAEAANDAEATVTRLFAALEQQDYEGATALVTADFELVEDTVIMDMPALVGLARSYAERGATMKRELDDFRTEVRGEVAWTRYRHDGALSIGDRRIDLHWIETAILERVDGEWRIDRMHSTPVRRNRN